MEGYEIKVPITLKGGNEGEKVGRQIGSKIAEQINKLNKSVGVGTSDSGGLMSGGLMKGLGKVSLILGATLVAVKGIFKQLKTSSPFLKGTFDTLKSAWNLMWKPFGDYVATALWPMTKGLMNMSIKWNKFATTEKGKKVVSDTVSAVGSAFTGDWTQQRIEGIKKLTDALGDIDFSKIKEFGSWLWGKVITIWDDLGDIASRFGDWLWEKIQGIWSWTKDVGEWLWGKVKSIWSWGKDVGTWLWDKITGIWNYAKDFGSWLWGELKDAFSGLGSAFKNFGTWLWDTVTGWFTKDDIDSKGSDATGNDFIAADGLYKLHRGEEVVTRNNTRNNKSYSPTFNFEISGESSVDVEGIAQRTGQLMQMDLQQRGLI